jgi:membrane protein DedA with SNARE-associated domain
MPHFLVKELGGYASVALSVGIENIGIPFPGETALIGASIYAGATHHLNILLVIACAAVGATLGGSAGYWIGRQFGYRLLIGYGRYVWMTPARIKLGQYLFLRFGAKIVLFGRFLPVVRVIIAFLAGANEMNWPRFFAFNAAGSTLWACVVGTAVGAGRGARRRGLSAPAPQRAAPDRRCRARLAGPGDVKTLAAMAARLTPPLRLRVRPGSADDPRRRGRAFRHAGR